MFSYCLLFSLHLLKWHCHLSTSSYATVHALFLLYLSLYSSLFTFQISGKLLYASVKLLHCSLSIVFAISYIKFVKKETLSKDRFSQREESRKTTRSSGESATDVGCEVVQYTHTLSKMLYNIRPRPYKIKTALILSNQTNQPKSCCTTCPYTDQHFMQHDQVVQQVG